MKTLKEKKGFTLVELLAVIVVLGIVTVIGATTVLPLVGKSQKNALLTEANELAESASQAVSLISINSYTDAYTKYDNGYCFTVQNLVDAGLWKKKDTTGYAGMVYVTKSNNVYTYEVELHNENYYVDKSGNIKVEDVKDYSATDTNVTATFACPNGGTAVNAS